MKNIPIMISAHLPEGLRVLSSDWIHLLLTLVAAVLIAAFTWLIFFRGISVWFKLRKLAKAVTRLSNLPRPQLRSSLEEVFTGPWLGPCWQEYAETLHDQRKQFGLEDRVVDVRATAPAANFFSSEVLVDARLHTEFFKHLPGIFTGIGIIATFTGLIGGLQSFDVTAVEPDALKQNLAGLFGHVRDAFLMSGGAIALAMICTLVEKFIYAGALHHAGELAAKLDALFKAGVGEEYLSQLVASSEEGTAQTKQLKESLVDELKVLLTNLTERQILATEQMSADLGKNLQQSLQEPLSEIAHAVKLASGEQTNVAKSAIEELMTAFMAQMRETLGAQMEKLNAAIGISAQAMTDVESSLKALIEDMRGASDSTLNSVKDTISDLLRSLQEREESQAKSLADAQLQALDAIRRAVEGMAQSQETVAQKLSEAALNSTQAIAAVAERAQTASGTAIEQARNASASIDQSTRNLVTELQGATTGLVGQLQKHQAEQQAASAEAQRAVLGEIKDAVTQMAGSLAKDVQVVTGAAERATQDIIDSVSKAQQTNEEAAKRNAQIAAAISSAVITSSKELKGSIEKIVAMLSGLESVTGRLGQAASQFTELQSGAALATRQLQATSDALKSTSDAVLTSTAALTQSAGQFQDTAATMASEAQSRSDTLATIRTSLAESQRAAEEFASYSSRVTGALEQALSKFGDQTGAVINRILSDFDRELGSAVQTLHGLIERMSAYAVDVDEGR